MYNMSMKTTLEIIDETAIHFSSHPFATRSVSLSGECRYLTDDGRMCSVGRCMQSPTTDLSGSPYSLWRDSDKESLIEFESQLKPEYRGHNAEFWTDLQEFHDGSEYWTVDGLSELGKDRLEELQLDYPSDI